MTGLSIQVQGSCWQKTHCIGNILCSVQLEILNAHTHFGPDRLTSNLAALKDLMAWIGFLRDTDSSYLRVQYWNKKQFKNSVQDN